MQLSRGAEEKLPEQEDITRLDKEVNWKLKRAIRELEPKNCYINFREVQEILLSFATIHNGRRQGSLPNHQSMITKANFRRGALTPAERIQLEKYSCVRGTSKKYSSVNVLLPIFLEFSNS